MVGGDHIDRPVGKPLKQSLSVGGIAQRRIHLKASLVAKVGVREGQVMRARLAGDVKPRALCLADQGNALLTRNVTVVIGAPRLGNQEKVPLDLPPLALRADPRDAVCPRVRAVVDDAAAQKAVILAVR